MSDELVGRYRRVYVRIWSDPVFRALSPTEQRVTFYVLTGPQTNRIGLFRFSMSTAAEDLNIGIETFRKALTNVRAAFNWQFDADARVFYIPSWWRWNLSVNTNIFRGNLKDLSEIPSCGLVDAFAQNTAYLPPELHETFIEACRKRLPKASRTTGSVARSEKQGNRSEEKNTGAALRAVAAPSLNSTNAKADNGLVSIAKTVLMFTSPNASIDSLYDAFRNYHRDDNLTRGDIVAALNQAVLESRASA